MIMLYFKKFSENFWNNKFKNNYLTKISSKRELNNNDRGKIRIGSSQVI